MAETEKRPAKRATKAGKPAYVFFNCDEEKSHLSMNIFYNREVFRDTGASRKALWRKVQEEVEAKRIELPSEDVDKAEKEILHGNPTAASQYLRFGAIEELTCH